MKKILRVARREIISTMMTKGFIVGVLITPVLMGTMIVVMPILIDDGRKVLDDSLDHIRSRAATDVIAVEPMDPGADLAGLTALPAVAATEKVDRSWRFTLADGANPHEAMQALLAAVPAARVELHRPNLEDIFVELVDIAAAAEKERAHVRASLRDDGAAVGDEVAP